MIHPSNSSATTHALHPETPKAPHYTLNYTQNDRMAGSVPEWRKNDDQSSTIALHNNTNAGGGFSFRDALDIVNPLQHIPIVSHVYRKITGDEIKPMGQIVGGGIYGGAMGAGAGLVNVIAQNMIGKDVTQTALDAISPMRMAAQDADRALPSIEIEAQRQPRTRSHYND